MSADSSGDTSSSGDEEEGGRGRSKKAPRSTSPGGKRGAAGSSKRAGKQDSRSKSTDPSRGFKVGSRSAGRLQHQGSMQERLQAVMQARQHKESAAEGQERQHVDTRDYTDPDHLGMYTYL